MRLKTCVGCFHTFPVEEIHRGGGRCLSCRRAKERARDRSRRPGWQRYDAAYRRTRELVLAESTKRHPTKTAGVYFRLREDGSRSYVIGFQDGPKWRWETVRGDYEDAKAERGRRLDKLSSGERVTRWGKRNVADVGAEYLADAESGLKRGKEHRRQFEKEIVPAWGNHKLGLVFPARRHQPGQEAPGTQAVRGDGCELPEARPWHVRVRRSERRPGG